MRLKVWKHELVELLEQMCKNGMTHIVVELDVGSNVAYLRDEERLK